MEDRLGAVSSATPGHHAPPGVPRGPPGSKWGACSLVPRGSSVICEGADCGFGRLCFEIPAGLASRYRPPGHWSPPRSDLAKPVSRGVPNFSPGG